MKEDNDDGTSRGYLEPVWKSTMLHFYYSG